MSYTKYKTRGIVIGGSNVGEASRIYNIFTRDFGLVRVRAQGVRNLNSKLKSHLQNLYLINAHLIKGKSGWRVTESYKIRNLPESFGSNKSKLQSVARTLLFLKRMLPEEDGNAFLFDIISGALNFLEKEENLNDNDILNAERLTILRVMRNLGYIKERVLADNFLESLDYNKILLGEIDKIKSLATREINESIKASQL
jgi:DNA repair protein RecO